MWKHAKADAYYAPAAHARRGQLNNMLAVAFGVLIVALVILGSLWIMSRTSTR